jgi:hypothetical protein
MTVNYAQNVRFEIPVIAMRSTSAGRCSSFPEAKRINLVLQGVPCEVEDPAQSKMASALLAAKILFFRAGQSRTSTTIWDCHIAPSALSAKNSGPAVAMRDKPLIFVLDSRHIYEDQLKEKK